MRDVDASGPVPPPPPRAPANGLPRAFGRSRSGEKLQIGAAQHLKCEKSTNRCAISSPTKLKQMKSTKRDTRMQAFKRQTMAELFRDLDYTGQHANAGLPQAPITQVLSKAVHSMGTTGVLSGLLIVPCTQFTATHPTATSVP